MELVSTVKGESQSLVPKGTGPQQALFARSKKVDFMVSADLKMARPPTFPWFIFPGDWTIQLGDKWKFPMENGRASRA
jgi:hypothetical protein